MKGFSLLVTVSSLCASLGVARQCDIGFVEYPEDSGICVPCGGTGPLCDAIPANTCNWGYHYNEQLDSCVECGFDFPSKPCQLSDELGGEMFCRAGFVVVDSDCVTCGKNNEPVCGSEDPCLAGFVPSIDGDTCVRCGTLGGPICDSGGEECHNKLTNVDGYCQKCGTKGMPPCTPGEEACYACERGLTLVNGFCEPCGKRGQPACDAAHDCSGCGAFSTPDSSSPPMCVPCGRQDQPGCSSFCQHCLPGLVYDAASESCKPCGRKGQPICDQPGDYSCPSDKLTAKDGVCVPCGKKGGPACEDLVVKCGPGLVEQGGECVKCGKNNHPICTNPGERKCDTRFVVDLADPNKCVRCGRRNQPICYPECKDENCETCSEDDTATCQQCSEGMAISNDGKCAIVIDFEDVPGRQKTRYAETSNLSKEYFKGYLEKSGFLGFLQNPDLHPGSHRTSGYNMSPLNGLLYSRGSTLSAVQGTTFQLLSWQIASAWSSSNTVTVTARDPSGQQVARKQFVLGSRNAGSQVTIHFDEFVGLQLGSIDISTYSHVAIDNINIISQPRADY